MPETKIDFYRRAYILLMAACNNALDLLPGSADAAAHLLQSAVEQAEEIFLSDPETTI
jgi:hypothetical protein